MGGHPGAALITGIAGFSGSHLTELLLDRGQKAAGVEPPVVEARNLETILSDGRLYRADLREEAAIRRVLAEVRPTQVYHLAALIHPPPNDVRSALLEANVLNTVRLLDAVLAECPAATVLIAGSAAQ